MTEGGGVETVKMQGVWEGGRDVFILQAIYMTNID